MSHRINIYNITTPSKIEDSDVMVMEWNYEIPLLLQALFIEGGEVGKNIYNTHTDPDYWGLYYELKPGIENLRRFYHFIEKHPLELALDTGKFLEAKTKLFNYLENLPNRYLHIDAWDVFNMDDTPHKYQASQLLASLQQNNQAINNVIQADDISLLDFKLFTNGAAGGFDNFAALLNFSAFDFGWAVIYQEHKAPGQVEIFEENGLYGLKAVNGDVLISPGYDDFYEFDYNTDLAVVVKNNQFGYVNKAGEVAIALSFDDAFDFEGDYAVVQKGGKIGLITLNGQIKFLGNYDNIKLLQPYDQFCSAEINGKHGIINVDGIVILPFQFDHEIADNGTGWFYQVEENGKNCPQIFSDTFKFLGNLDPAFIDPWQLFGAENFVYQIRKHQYQEVNKLVTTNNEVLLTEYEKVVQAYPGGILIYKAKRYGLFKYGKHLVLEFLYHQIIDLKLYLTGSLKSYIPAIPADIQFEPYVFFKVIKDKAAGLYFSIANFEAWLLKPVYEDIKPIYSGFFAVKLNGKWGMISLSGKIETAIEYDEILETIVDGEIAYALKDDEIYVIREFDVLPAGKTNLQQYMDVNIQEGYSFFDRQIQFRMEAYLNRH
ncbi:hypothetical protein GJU39_00740 [Pedobacter petrophilus]|uniref:DUF7822 domain-containing protein n=1 Tax=Pedobacter petrophilus TaxID=1908241 RepID=A0A7K0FSL1_9SPHI|nr:WG repeat-containing protein [Pedobacter petrophilus]MRX74598.1 hypothetical protein [Pedobacter petrophilus]